MSNETPTPESLSDWFRRIGTKLNRDDYEDGIAALHANGEQIQKLTESNRRLANQIVGYGDRVQESVRSIQADAWQAGYEIGGHDYMMAEDSGTGLSACRANPYRTEPTTNH